jgi:aminoglycoside phosphotransferase (APT) family kinase protein
MPADLEPAALDRLWTWLDPRVGPAAPLQAGLIAGGLSNLTYRVIDAAGRSWALRRPPHGPLLPSAHDVVREHRIIAALHAATDVPVPAPVGACEDCTVLGAPFMVMEFVDGLIVRGRRSASAVDETTRGRVADNLIDALVRLHAVDVDGAGLGDLAARSGYLERQLRRWLDQFVRSASREVPGVERVHDWLAADVPAAGDVRLVHGDFRLDNAVIRPDGSIAALLDWEIATLGDPMADLGLLVAYWAGDGDEHVGATSLPGFPDRATVVQRYAARSGRDVSQFGWYLAFSYWKLACVAEGVYARYRRGGGGGDQRDRLAELSPVSAAMAARALRAAGMAENTK